MRINFLAVQVAKQLILSSPCMEKVLFRMFNNVDAVSVTQGIVREHGWFNELVDAVGVRFCGVIKENFASMDFSEIDIEEMEQMVTKKKLTREIYSAFQQDESVDALAFLVVHEF
jgi:hypothetical protein